MLNWWRLEMPKVVDGVSRQVFAKEMDNSEWNIQKRVVVLSSPKEVLHGSY